MGTLSELGLDEGRLTEILEIHNMSLKWMYDNLSEKINIRSISEENISSDSAIAPRHI